MASRPSTYSFLPDFSYASLPYVNKPVFRMGVAGNYGLESDNIRWAADQGVNYWVWGASFKKVTEGIRDVIQKDRASHVLTVFGWGYFGWQYRKTVEKALRLLKTDYIDIFKLSWLSKTSFYNKRILDTVLQLKEEGKIRVIGCSIHDRKKAGELAVDSEIEAFMIRYNAKHPGAEKDIFPYLYKRNPALISYTALAWQQLIKPMNHIEMPPYPGERPECYPPLSPELCYRFVLSNPHVHLVLTGPKNQSQLENNLRTMEKGPLSQEEIQWVKEYGQKVKAKKRFVYF